MYFLQNNFIQKEKKTLNVDMWRAVPVLPDSTARVSSLQDTAVSGEPNGTCVDRPAHVKAAPDSPAAAPSCSFTFTCPRRGGVVTQHSAAGRPRRRLLGSLHLVVGTQRGTLALHAVPL